MVTGPRAGSEVGGRGQGGGSPEIVPGLCHPHRGKYSHGVCYNYSEVLTLCVILIQCVVLTQCVLTTQ